MPKHPITILLSLFILNSFAQVTPSVEEFKKSIHHIQLTKIKPIGYKTIGYDWKEPIYASESIITNDGDYMIKENSLAKIVTIDSALTNQFIDLVYSDSTTSWGTSCYIPRHGILVWGETRYLGFIEICFECGKIKTTDGIPTPKNIDYSILSQLKALFQKYGMIDPVYQPVQKKEKKKK